MGHQSAEPPAKFLYSVSASLKSGAQGKEVNNLNQCLVFLLINGAGIIDKSLLDPALSLNWLNDLFHQKIEQYGPVTTSLIQLFQKKQQLVVTGSIDQETANRLNAVLIHTGAFDQPTPNKGSVYKSNRSVAHNGQQKIPFVDVGLQQDQLIETINPLQRLHNGEGKLEKPEVDVDAISAHLLRLSVKNGEYTYAKADDIVMVESSDHLTIVHVAQGCKVKITLRNSCLKDFLLDLPKKYFLRVNRFCAVNLNRLSGGSYQQQFLEFDYCIRVKPRHPLTHAIFNSIGR